MHLHILYIFYILHAISFLNVFGVNSGEWSPHAQSTFNPHLLTRHMTRVDSAEARKRRGRSGNDEGGADRRADIGDVINRRFDVCIGAISLVPARVFLLVLVVYVADDDAVAVVVLSTHTMLFVSLRALNLISVSSGRGWCCAGAQRA